MTFNEYQNHAISTAIYPVDLGIIYPALGLSGESGEIANKVKKIFRDERGVLTAERRLAIIDEAGDALWYLAALLRDVECTMDYAAEVNIRKLARRKEQGTLQGSGDTR